jgi:hypothetical protein
MKTPYEKFHQSNDYKLAQEYVCDYIAFMLKINHDAASVLEKYIDAKNPSDWVDYLMDCEDFLKTMTEFVKKL